MSTTSSEDIGRMAEGAYRGILENLHPGIRHMIAMGRAYEKALIVVSHAAKSYFESIVKLGEIASETKASRQLGEILLQIAATLRDIETQREIAAHSFHKELLVPVEASVDQLQKDLLNKQKNYSQGNKVKTEALEKARNDYKKYQKKSQKNTAKYTEKERRCEQEFTQKEQALNEFRAQSLKTVWQEERRRYCFLILRQCEVLKNNSVFHGKAVSLYRHRIPEWQKNSDHPDRLPSECENTLQVFKQGFIDVDAHGEMLGGRSQQRRQYRQNLSVYTANMDAEESLHSSGRENIQKPLTVDVEPGPMMYPSATLPNPKKHSVMQPSKQLVQQQFATIGKHRSYSSFPKHLTPRHHSTYSQALTWRRVRSMIEADVLNSGAAHIRNKSDGAMNVLESGNRVQAIYSHMSSGQNQLTFNEGEVIMLVGERKNGWHFGKSLVSMKSGWFPIAYTEPLQETLTEIRGNGVPQSSLIRPKSEGNLVDLDPNLPMPDYGRETVADQGQSNSYTGLLTTAPAIPIPPPLPSNLTFD